MMIDGNDNYGNDNYSDDNHGNDNYNNNNDMRVVTGLGHSHLGDSGAMYLAVFPAQQSGVSS